MTKEEYQDFVLRYKGCGACFPMYHTLSRFEKMWFTAIQKEVAALEKENAELKADFIKSCKVKEQGFREAEQALERKNQQLTKAKEIIKKLKAFFLYPIVTEEDLKRQEETLSEVEQFLNSEVEK